MLRITIVTCALLVGGCQAAPSTHEEVAGAPRTINGLKVTGGDGSSMEKAVAISARTASEGVPAEYAWIRENYPGAKPEMTGLIPGKRGKYYDAITIVTADGKKVTVYFDITRYWGRL